MIYGDYAVGIRNAVRIRVRAHGKRSQRAAHGSFHVAKINRIALRQSGNRSSRALARNCRDHLVFAYGFALQFHFQRSGVRKSVEIDLPEIVVFKRAVIIVRRLDRRFIAVHAAAGVHVFAIPTGNLPADSVAVNIRKAFVAACRVAENRAFAYARYVIVGANKHFIHFAEICFCTYIPTFARENNSRIAAATAIKRFAAAMIERFKMHVNIFNRIIVFPCNALRKETGNIRAYVFGIRKRYVSDSSAAC